MSKNYKRFIGNPKYLRNNASVLMKRALRSSKLEEQLMLEQQMTNTDAMAKNNVENWFPEIFIPGAANIDGVQREEVNLEGLKLARNSILMQMDLERLLLSNVGKWTEEEKRAVMFYLLINNVHLDMDEDSFSSQNKQMRENLIESIHTFLESANDGKMRRSSIQDMSRSFLQYFLDVSRWKAQQISDKAKEILSDIQYKLINYKEV